ncbi:MAG: MetQ/NlpA family ABC transporter substrate-binding protein [Firmicutes bacterium]|nr:MetQ/NlpA family ABC transporter substrate-binding protein [Bacillota bacterium]
MNLRKHLTLIGIILVLALSLAACTSPAQPGGDDDGADAPETVTLKVGATTTPHAEILTFIKPELTAEGIDLDVQEFSDYAQLNPALDSGELDANYFQHIPYLDSYNEGTGSDLVVMAGVHIEPLAIYSETITDIGAIQEGAVVAIPNDATNGGRALLLLEKAGLITLTDGAGLEATILDISDNPKNIDIMELEAASLPRTLGEVDVAVINTNYALEANLNPREDAIFIEDKDSPYVNVLVVRAEDKDNEDLQKLAQALNTEAVRNFINENYGGAVVPAF